MDDSNTPLFARDMDLVREILLWAEKGGSATDAPKVDQVKLAYHCHIMSDGQLIDGTGELYRRYGPTAGWNAGIIQVKGLTWKGHEFLEAMRNETTWTKVKEIFGKHGAPFLTELLMSAAKTIVAKQIGLPLS